MDVAALQFCSRFALGPNIKGYCGQDSAPAHFKDCIENGICDHVQEELEKFIVLNPYLETISQITGLDKFSYDVIESYWLGNDLCKKAKLEHYNLLLENFSKQGVPDWLTEELKNKQPKVFIPTHAFQVLYIGVGRASGAVPFNKHSVENCLITTRGKTAYHWSKKIRLLTPREQKNLAFWTKEVLTKVAPMPLS